MQYIIKIAKKAKKFIDKQDRGQRERIYKAIKNLPNGDIKKMQNHFEIYRLRVGDYRLLFEYKYNEIIITVIDIDNRGDIYKRY